MVRFIQRTLVVFLILFAKSLHAFESHIAYIPTLSVGYAHHLVWGEFQIPLYRNNYHQDPTNIFKQKTFGIGYNYLYQYNTAYYLYYYQDIFTLPSSERRAAIYNGYKIDNLGLGLQLPKVHIGVNGYYCRIGLYNTLGAYSAPTTPPPLVSDTNLKLNETQRVGADLHINFLYSKYSQFFGSVFYNQIKQHSIPSHMVGVAVGLQFSKTALQISYDNRYGKRITLNIHPIDLKYSINSANLVQNKKPLVRRHIGTNLRSATNNQNKMQLNQWVSETLHLSPQPTPFDMVVASSLIRLEKNSRIMLYQLANAEHTPPFGKRPYLPTEIRILLGNEIVANDIFKPNYFLDDAPINTSPLLNPIPSTYQKNAQLSNITVALFDHYRHLHNLKLGD